MTTAQFIRPRRTPEDVCDGLDASAAERRQAVRAFRKRPSSASCQPSSAGVERLAGHFLVRPCIADLDDERLSGLFLGVHAHAARAQPVWYSSSRSRLSPIVGKARESQEVDVEPAEDSASAARARRPRSAATRGAPRRTSRSPRARPRPGWPRSAARCRRLRVLSVVDRRSATPSPAARPIGRRLQDADDGADVVAVLPVLVLLLVGFDRVPDLVMELGGCLRFLPVDVGNRRLGDAARASPSPPS